jgi:cytochrome c-type biogenesis protein CcmH
LWTAAGLLTLAVALGLAWPLLRRRGGGLARGASALRVLRDQLSEVDRELDRGVITAAEAEAARTEIKRRMLTLTRNDPQARSRPEAEDAPRSAPFAARLAVLALALFGPGAALILYAQLGSPEVPSRPLAERGAEFAQTEQTARFAEQLQTRLVSDPNPPRGAWIALGAAYMELGRTEAAADAFREAAARDDAQPEAFTRLAEALIFANDGAAPPEATRALDQALALEPGNPAAVFYKSVALEQAGARDEARALVAALVEDAPADAPWLPEFRTRLAALGGEAPAAPVGPSAAEVEAAGEMSTEDRDAMIRGMVERLAARLEAEPDDVEGWRRLARSYEVLGEAEKAAEAQARAEALASGN